MLPRMPLSSPYLEAETTSGTFKFGPLGWCDNLGECSGVGVPYNISEVMRDATGYNGIRQVYTGRTALADDSCEGRRAGDDVADDRDE